MKSKESMTNFRTVIVESPYSGDIEENVKYARACIRDCLKRGEAPFASHLLYTQPGVLRDEDPEERALGIEAGLAIGECLVATVVYVDRGITQGMIQGILAAWKAGRTYELRSLQDGPEVQDLQDQHESQHDS